MARAPDLVIIARHGARLDAADKTWHLTSPAPYDTPLTYGGWNQSKALGSRIAAILYSRAIEKEAQSHPSSTWDGSDWRQKYKIVLHSSPFIRCVQTSVAIAAGLAQFDPSGESTPDSRNSSVSGGRTRQRSRPTIEEEEEDEDAIMQDVMEEPKSKTDFCKSGKPVLRIDAFLGEWLCTDYYEDITHPPESPMMLASAKAGLLRQEEIDVFRPSAAARGHFPGGWQRADSSSQAERPEPATLTSLRQAAVRSHRNSLSGGTVTSHGPSLSYKGHKDVRSSFTPSHSRYISPIPAWTVQSSEPIPKGYMAHARDECVDMDLHWDSMRGPQDWGDGGTYGDSWSALHVRLRTGLWKMISWYKIHGAEESFPRDCEDSRDRDRSIGPDNRELIVVLVTHGSGCNALVGGLTNQPVLIDFAMASLTVAERKADVDSFDDSSLHRTRSNSSLPPRRRSSVDFGLAEEYSMRLTASSDHLKYAAEASRVTALQSPHLVPQIPAFGSGQVTDHNSKPKSRNAALGSIRRSAAAASAAMKSELAYNENQKIQAAPSAWLWSAPARPAAGPSIVSQQNAKARLSPSPPEQIEELSLGPSMSNDIPASSRIEQAIDDDDNDDDEDDDEGADDNDDQLSPLRTGSSRSKTQHGLWIAPRSVQQIEAVQESPRSKRRWTINQNEGVI